MANRYEILEGFKAKVTLFSGGEVTLDMMKITAKEWRDLSDPKQIDNDEAALIAKAASMKVEDILAMPQPDYRLIIEAMVKLAISPLENPT